MNLRRFRYNEVFHVESGRISPRIPIQIGGVTMGPGVSFGEGVMFSGVNLAEHVGEDIAGYIENGVLIIKGFYS